MGKRELIAFLNLSSWCLVMVERLFLVVPRGCLLLVIVVFPDHTHLLFLYVMTETHFSLRKNLKNIMHSLVKMYVMRYHFIYTCFGGLLSNRTV